MRYSSKPWWMSSTQWKSDMAQGGIFSDDPSESPFYNSNLIWLKYCSSDIWTGNVGASDATYGYSFRGFEIITSTIQSLIADQGMGSTEGAVWSDRLRTPHPHPTPLPLSRTARCAGRAS